MRGLRTVKIVIPVLDLIYVIYFSASCAPAQKRPRTDKQYGVGYWHYIAEVDVRLSHSHCTLDAESGASRERTSK